MKLNYVPLLQVQRELQGMPRGMARFGQYLRTLMKDDGSDVELTPLLAMNPMGKDHVTNLLAALLAMDADAIGAREAEAASDPLVDVPGEYRAALVIVDDLMGGWTNRYDQEFVFRFGPRPLLNRSSSKAMARRLWVIGLLWSSEPASEQSVSLAIRTAAFRVAYTSQNGPASTIREMLAQEGAVMAMAGCAGPVLDPEDLEYTREVLTPHLDADDKRTAIECLFGDPAARSLGFTPRGLTPWAGLALALHDVKTTAPGAVG